MSDSDGKVTGLTCQCSASKRAFREAVADLLLLERDGIKFNGRQCFAYFLQFSLSLDQQFLSKLPGKCPPSDAPPSITTDHLSVIPPVQISENTYEMGAYVPEAVVEEMTRELRDECNRLRAALYLPSEDGNLIPFIFRRADPAYDSEGRFRSAFDIDDDGFEIVV